jgi:hypothetical protein
MPMDEGVTTASSDDRRSVSITVSPSSAASTLSSQQIVCDAVALGWSIVELLGRCFRLSEPTPSHPDWYGARLVLLQQVYTPREMIRSLMTYIKGLADNLRLSSCIIDNAQDEHNGRAFVDVVEELVKQFCAYQLSAAPDRTFEELRGKINRYLFFWDLQIHDALQNRPTVVAKAYMIGRTLAALRWWSGLADQQLDGASVEKVYREYIPILAPYISAYAPAALANSAELWWKAMTSGQVLLEPGGEVPIELQNQANIWFSLLTNERTAFSYVPPALVKKSGYYSWQVLRLYWGFFAGGILVLLVILVLVVVLLLSHYDLIIKGIATAAGFISATGIAQVLGSNFGTFLQKATTDVEATRDSIIGNIQKATEQQQVLKATYIAPRGVGTSKLKRNGYAERTFN